MFGCFCRLAPFSAGPVQAIGHVDNPNRPGLRPFQKVSGARPRAPLEIKLDFKLRLFPEIPLASSFPVGKLRLLPPPLRKDSLAGDKFGSFRRRFGPFRLQDPKREGGRRRGGSGERKRRRCPGSQHLALPVGRVLAKKGRLAEGLRRLRETKAASEVKGARGCCGGCQRGFLRLRGVEAERGKTGFCACVANYGRIGSSRLRAGRTGSRAPIARARDFLLGWWCSVFPTVKRGRPLLVALATIYT